MTTGTLAAGGLVAPAIAAETTSVCSSGCAFTTIQDAVDAASAGDTVRVSGPLTVAGTTTVGKDVTVTGGPGAIVTQTANAITFLVSGAGATLANLTITSDIAYAQEFVQIGADDVTLSGNTIHGPEQPGPMSGWVTNRGIVTQGSISGLSVTGNTLYSMRSGAYLNPNGTGAIAGNTVHDTKGDFLIDNANFTFRDSRSGNASQPSEWGFVIFLNTDAERYPSVAALSAANNDMTVLDRRTDEEYVVPTTAADCKGSGWKNRNPEFRNQGQCIKFVNTGR
ncbi:right-handed parallel beta-helix repeat-containing protein [Blastococcus sp. CT_GayMR19]|uniref:right-handed parallel beta-helix repeat-containing protein n=1 Tax=Blastococcus sp. CT_GayMR19 TaxID=2559608 RepID=UPI0014311C12|nr:right-handed parallel beta-helix repeat-containing protein [Blastococcus sp. CT_GayMR19]